jgi:TRAP-type C4-dicarboxylate transport system permease small subunit
MILPDVLSMPRQQLLDWVSVLLRSAVSVLLLLAGWQLYKLLFSVRQTPAYDEVGAAT